jgi:pimeloyl-ACP methyl ester carboxylesterase
MGSDDGRHHRRTPRRHPDDRQHFGSCPPTGCDDKKGGADADHCLGRSRGGLTTKIHAVVDAQGLPIRLGLTTGQAHDGQIADALLPGPAPLAIFTHVSDVGRNQLRTWSFSTEAHWLRHNGFAVLALMRRGRGRSEGINGEEDFGRDHEGGLIDVSAGIAQAVEDLESALAYGRQLRGVRPGPVVLAGQSRGGFLAIHCAGLKPGEVMGVVNFSGGWYPYGPVTGGA